MLARTDTWKISFEGDKERAKGLGLFALKQAAVLKEISGVGVNDNLRVVKLDDLGSQVVIRKIFNHYQINVFVVPVVPVVEDVVLAEEREEELGYTSWLCFYDRSSSTEYYGAVYDYDTNGVDVDTEIEIWDGTGGSSSAAEIAMLSNGNGYAVRCRSTDDAYLWKNNVKVKTITYADFNGWVGTKPYTKTNSFNRIFKPGCIDHDGNIIINYGETDNSGSFHSWLLKFDSNYNFQDYKYMDGGNELIRYSWLTSQYVVAARNNVGSSIYPRRILKFYDKTSLNLVQTLDVTSTVDVIGAFERNGSLYLLGYDNPGYKVIKVDLATWGFSTLWSRSSTVLSTQYGSASEYLESIYVDETETNIVLIVRYNTTGRAGATHITYDSGTGTWGSPVYNDPPNNLSRIQEHIVV